MSDLQIMFAFLCGTLLFFALIIYGCFVWANWMSEVTCMDRWSDRNPTYSWTTGCMIDTDAGRIPAGNFLVTL